MPAVPADADTPDTTTERRMVEDRTAPPTTAHEATPAHSPAPSAPAVDPLRATAPLRDRDTSIDVLRGWFIISMTIAHLSAGSVLERVSHAAVWLDGAIGFVTLSGLVLGMVYRRTADRTGRVPYRRALRRARLLYVIQAVTLVLALAVSAARAPVLGVRPPDELGGWPSALGMVVTMRLPAPYLDVLPMYVVLLLAAAPALALLARARTTTLLVVSAVVYVVAATFPERAVPSGVHFNWSAWQLPFIVGLAVGWHWDGRGLGGRLRSRPVVTVAAAVAVTCFVTAQAFGRLDVMGGSAVDHLVGAAFTKYNLGPAHIVFGLAAMVVGYAGVSLLRDAGRARAVRTWLAILGSRSLDAFVILCLAVVVLPAVLHYRASSPTAMVLVVVTLGLQTAWIQLRRRGAIPGLATGTAVPARPLPRPWPRQRASSRDRAVS